MKASKILVIVLLATFGFTAVKAQTTDHKMKRHSMMRRHHRIIRHQPIQ